METNNGAEAYDRKPDKHLRWSFLRKSLTAESRQISSKKVPS